MTSSPSCPSWICRPSPGVRFVFPHAPMRPVTINAGWVMRAWYDVREDAGVRQEDPPGVRASQREIDALIAREQTRGVAARRIVLAGFSQGGAMALHTGLRHPERLAGIMALSCSLPLADTVAAEASPANRDVPIFMAHGTQDPLIPLARGAARPATSSARSATAWTGTSTPCRTRCAPRRFATSARGSGQWSAEAGGPRHGSPLNWRGP